MNYFTITGRDGKKYYFSINGTPICSVFDRNGEKCRNIIEDGERICRMHGGKSIKWKQT